MEPGDGIYVERTLPIDGALLSEVLLRLRRDTEGSTIRWTLGDQGAIEIDVNIVSAGNAWTTTARLACGLALVPATLQLAPLADDEVEVKLEAQQPTPEWLVTRHRELAALAHAAINELAEELLWHGARAGVASQH
jgi:hypothetical protein